MTDISTLERLLRELRLSKMGMEWHPLEKIALSEGWSPSRYLLALCAEESGHRTVARLRRELVCCAAEVLSTFIDAFYTVHHVHTASRKAIVPAR